MNKMFGVKQRVYPQNITSITTILISLKIFILYIDYKTILLIN